MPSNVVRLSDYRARHDAATPDRQQLIRELSAAVDLELAEEREVIDGHARTALTAFLTCRGCGCSDSNPCLDRHGHACHWADVSPETGFGVCSVCCPPGAIK